MRKRRLRTAPRTSVGIRSTLICFALFSVTAFADYAWIPAYQKAVFRLGGDWTKSSRNFDNDGNVSNFSISGNVAEMRDFQGHFFTEFGIAKNWSVWGRLQFMDSVATSQITDLPVASGTGFGDTWAGFKVQVADSYPLLTGEMFFKFPTGTTTAIATQNLVTGEGNFDLGLRGHLGLKQGPVFLSISPGLLVRTGGYSTAVLLEGAAQYNFPTAYARVFAEAFLPLAADALPPSTPTNHNLLGAGGSYMKLAASPVSIGMGVRAGYNFVKDLGMEANFSLNFTGRRAPEFIKFGLNLILSTDFYEKDYRPTLREVPFNSEDEERETEAFE